jgi:hypothetical protein
MHRNEADLTHREGPIEKLPHCWHGTYGATVALSRPETSVRLRKVLASGFSAYLAWPEDRLAGALLAPGFNQPPSVEIHGGENG